MTICTPPISMGSQTRVPSSVHVLVLIGATFSALILTTLVTFSCPFITPLYFLRVESEGRWTRLGVFGCDGASVCSTAKAAYEYTPAANKSLTGAMLLWPICAIILLLATIAVVPLLVWGEMAAVKFPLTQHIFTLSIGFGALCTSVAWLLTIFGWCVAKQAFSMSGNRADLGPTVWMSLAATILSVLAASLGWPVQPDPCSRSDWAQRVSETATVPAAPKDGYYHYKKTTRDIVPNSTV